MTRACIRYFPELLEANGYAGADEVSFKLLSECNAVAHRHAA